MAPVRLRERSRTPDRASAPTFLQALALAQMPMGVRPCVRACVRAGVRAGGRAGVRACVRAC
eukprot:14060680-Alexandrium_andersonii.AAC.1